VAVSKQIHVHFRTRYTTSQLKITSFLYFTSFVLYILAILKYFKSFLLASQFAEDLVRIDPF
jgi:hypothetical protein